MWIAGRQIYQSVWNFMCGLHSMDAEPISLLELMYIKKDKLSACLLKMNLFEYRK